MPTFDEFRIKFPSLKNASDEEILERASKVFKLPMDSVMDAFGYEVNQPGLWSDTKRGIGQIIGSTGSTLRDIGAPDVGKSIERYGQDVAFKNPSEINSLSDIASKPGTTVREAVGELGPQVATSGGLALAGGAVGQTVGSVAGLPFGPGGVIAGRVVGGYVGAKSGQFLGNLVQEYGGIRQEQREAGIEDKTRALVGATGAAALDTAFGVEGAINKIATRKGLNILTREAGEGALKYAGKQTALGFGVEALTEGAQTGIERWAAHKDLMNNEALNEYGVSAIKGGIGGGGVRGGLSLFANKAPGETDPGVLNKKDEIGQAFQQKDNTQPDPSTATPATTTRDPATRLAELEAISKGVPAREHITPDGEIVKIPGQEGRYFTPAEQAEYRTLKGLASPQAAQPPALSAGVMSGLTGGGGDPLAGRSNLVGGGPAPAVAGGSTDIAVAQQQAQVQNQQAQAQQQQNQAAQVASQQFGIVNPNTPAIGNVFGQKVYGPNIQAAAGALANFTTQMQPHQLQMAQAITQANNATGNKLIKYQFNANDVVSSVQKGLQAVQKVANQFQIGHTQSVDEAAAILNDQSEQLHGEKLDQLNAIFQALTGQNTNGYEAEQLSTLAKGAKNGKLQLQNNAGLREVPVQTGTGETGAGGNGPVRPAQVQPVGAAGLGEGSLGLQTGQLPAEGIRTGTPAISATNDGGGAAQNAQVTGAQNEATTNGAAGQQQTVVQGAAKVTPERLTNERIGAVSPELQTQSIEEQQAQEVPNLIRNALRMIYGSDRKVELLLHLTEKTNRSNYAKLAKDYGVTEQYVKELASDAITDEGETHPRFIVKNIDKFLSAVNHQAEIMNVSLLEALDGLEVINEVYGQNNNQLLGTQVNEEDIVASGLAIQNREERIDKNGKKIGKSDLTNVTNIVDEEDYRDRASEAYLSEMDRYEADPSEANQARLDAVTAAASAKNKDQAKKLYQKYQVLTGVRNAVQEQGADEGDVRQPTGSGEEVGEANAKPKKPTRARKAKTEAKPAEEAKQEVATVEAKPEEVKTPEEQWMVLADQFPMMPPYESLSKDEKIRWDDVASRGVANLAAANRVLTTTVKEGTPQTQGATRTAQAITDESMIVDGTGLVREITPEQRQLLEGPAKQLTDGQTARLEKHYGAKRGTAEFFTKLQEDVSRYATKGAEAVNAAVRDIIKAVYTGLLATAVVFNPTYMNQAEAYVYHAPQAYSIIKEVRAEAPAEAASKMSTAAKEAYATLVPALKADLVKRNKLFIMADKPSGRIFVFTPDGKLILEKKSLFGLAKGDFYKGNNDLPANRITPAGLHNIVMVDAAKGGAAAKTAGEYDFGKVFGIVDENPGVLTIMHSVWLKETDAAKRAAALKNENAADSRYSFGCINVDKATYKFLLDEHGEQMDGAKLFIVPDNQERLQEFVSGKVAQNLTGEDKLVRQAVKPVTETITGVRQNAEQAANIDRTQMGKEEEVRLASKSKSFYDASDLANEFHGVDAATDQLDALGIGHAMDYVSDWETINDTAEDAINGEIVSQGGRYKVVLNAAKLTSSNHATETVTHEVGHAVDMAPHGGIYSSQPEMSVVVKDGKITPIGIVARELHNLYNTDAGWNDYLEYPFDTSKFKELNNHVVVEGELFAQLFSAYVNPETRETIEKVAPQTAAFMAEVIKHVKSTKSLQLQTAPVAAQRTLAFKNRNTSGGGQTRGGITQGREQSRLASRSKEQKISSGSGAFASAGAWLDTAVTNPKGALRKVKLGFLTLEQLSDMDTSPNQVVRSYTDISDYMMMTSKELVNRAVKIDHLWAKLTPAMDTKLSEVMRTATRMGFDPALATNPSEKINQEQEDLVKLYDSLDKDSQNVYRQVRQHYQDLFEKRKAILESTAAKLGGKELQEVQEMYSKLKGPYFPLGRVGDYYAVGMSPRVAELMDKKEDSGLTSAETTELNSLRKQANQYKSSSFRTLSEAKEAAAKMKKEMGSGYFNEVAERIHEGVAGLPNFAKLEDYITSQLGGETRAEVQNMLSQMMFDMLPEHHALKSAMRREGIHGENENMRQVFAKSSLSQAHYISRLQYGEQLNEALQKVAKAARRDHDMRTIENELKLRAKLSMVDSQSALTDLAVNASYFAHLGLSPAFLISNMTQVPMITAPWLYARHGLNNSRMAMAQAIVDSAKIIKTTYKDGDWRSELNWNEQFPVGSREDRMLRTLSDRSALDITVEHDLAAVASANHGFFDDKISKATNGSLGGLGDVVKLVNTPVRVTELANRASTALAAYRLKWEALASAGLNDEDRHRVATDYARRAVSETQLNYSELNAPRYMRSLLGSKPLARLVFQFRKYQQGMLYLVTKNIADAFSGATKEERRIARRTIGGLYATTFLMAGTTGMPLMGTVGLAGISNLIAGMFGDDDEPWDFETEYRNFLTDWLGHDMALLVAKGIPAYLGADMSQKVGLAEIANPIPFVQRGSTGQSMLANTLYAAAGAPAGMVGSAMDGIMQMANGDILKGVEQIVPLKEAKDLLRSYRYSTEGLTDRRGNVVLPPESFSAWDIAFRGMGFTPTKESEYYAANEAMHTAEQAAKDTKNNLLRRYAEARMKDEDTDAIQEKIDAYNDRHPEKGVRITVSAMLKAVQQRRKMAEERTGSGVRIGKAQRPFADEARFAEDDEE